MSAHAWDLSRMHDYQVSTKAGDIVLSKQRVVRAILLEINEEKRPEKARYFFGVSNSSVFEINKIFTESKPMFPIAHDCLNEPEQNQGRTSVHYLSSPFPVELVLRRHFSLSSSDTPKKRWKIGLPSVQQSVHLLNIFLAIDGPYSQL